MDAANAPVRHAPRELHSADTPIRQKPAVEDRDDLEEHSLLVAPEVLHKEYLEALEFAEEPVTIRIERSSEKFAPPMIDCWCNGKGAEVLISNKWVALGYLPVGMKLTTKRKYVEILARAKLDSIRTQHQDATVETPRNEIQTFSSSRAPFSILEDRNPKGAAWATNILHYG